MKKEGNQRVVDEGSKRKMSLNILFHSESDFLSQISLTLIILYHE